MGAGLCDLPNVNFVTRYHLDLDDILRWQFWCSSISVHAERWYISVVHWLHLFGFSSLWRIYINILKWRWWTELQYMSVRLGYDTGARRRGGGRSWESFWQRAKPHSLAYIRVSCAHPASASASHRGSGWVRRRQDKRRTNKIKKSSQLITYWLVTSYTPNSISIRQ